MTNDNPLAVEFLQRFLPCLYVESRIWHLFGERVNYQALNFALEGAIFLLRGKICTVSVFGTLYWNMAEGTTAKAQGTTAFAVGVMGYL